MEELDRVSGVSDRSGHPEEVLHAVVVVPLQLVMEKAVEAVDVVGSKELSIFEELLDRNPVYADFHVALSIGTILFPGIGEEAA